MSDRILAEDGSVLITESGGDILLENQTDGITVPARTDIGLKIGSEAVDTGLKIGDETLAGSSG